MIASKQAGFNRNKSIIHYVWGIDSAAGTGAVDSSPNLANNGTKNRRTIPLALEVNKPIEKPFISGDWLKDQGDTL